MRVIDTDVKPESISEQPEVYVSRADEAAVLNSILYTCWALALVAAFTIT